jgi:Na+-transporting NADH:ubiquinone oxidoreductase subunit NqrC
MNPKQRNSTVYTIVFTIILSLICATLLTFANTQWAKRIAANKDYARIRAVLGTLGLVTGESTRSETMAIFNNPDMVLEKPLGAMMIYEGRKGGNLIGSAIQLQGQGKYGPIKGVLAVGPAKQKILALNIYEHQETPGLGGRISEPQWLARFQGVPLVTDGVPGVIISSKLKGPNVVHAISNASKTMYQVGKMINLGIVRFLSGGMELMEFRLVSKDKVTKGTGGYPTNAPKPPHLRKNEEKRAPFMVPPGTKNLALGKEVVHSEEAVAVEGEVEQITDGIKFCEAEHYVEFGPEPMWVQIDLGQPSTIFGVGLWHFYKNPIIYNDVIVQVADDAEFTKNKRTLFNNDHDNSAGEGTGKDDAYIARWWGELVDTRGEDKSGIVARYVRVWSNRGASEDHFPRFVEIDVYGKPVK